MNMHDVFINAILADAAYVGGLDDGLKAAELEKVLADRMTPALASYIAREFRVVSHLETNDFFESGFDGTIWRQISTGKVYVSMQGTVGFGDLSADGALALSTIARDQVADMVNWWFRETGESGKPVRQIQVLSEFFFVNAADGIGTGHIKAGDLARGVEVNGHSLGGYLSSVFARLFNLQVPKMHTMTFNGAGFSLGSDKALKQLETILGPGFGMGKNPSATEQNNFYAENGINLTTNDWWFTQSGERRPIFNEESAFAVSNHYMYKLTDALSLGDVMAKLDSSFDMEDLNALLKRSSNRTESSLENVLDALRKILIDEMVGATPVGDESNSALNRVKYYENLLQLTGGDDKGNPTGPFADFIGKVRITTPTHSVPVRTDELGYLAYLISLKNLLPVQITPLHLDALALLSARHVPLAEKIASDRVDAGLKELMGALNFSDAYLGSRALMLSTMIERNKTDTTGNSPYSNQLFYDTATNMKFRSGSPEGDDAGRTQMLFGDGNGNALIGGEKADQIYGDDGDDMLDGGSGNDYIEGGVGEDTLDGGAGNDFLRGGKDRDVYNFNSAFGNDTITDGDGMGKIAIDGNVITDGNGVGKRNQWVAKLASGEYVGMVVYNASSSVTGKRMIMTKGMDGSNSITIDNFDLAKAMSSEGYLGIKLEDQGRVALKIGPGKNVFNEPDFAAASLSAQLATISEGGAATFTMSLSAGAGAHDTVTLSLSGVSGKLMVMVGGIPVAADGAVIALSEGQTEVVFALIQRGDFSGDLAGTLKASYNGEGGASTTNTIALSLKDTGEATFTIIGDQHAPLDSTGKSYDWSKVQFLADGTLAGGGAEANFSDVLTGGTGKNMLLGLGGNDLLDGREGDDTIDGGDGDDMIAGAQGNDHILGGKGNDFISTASYTHGYRRRHPYELWTPPAGTIPVAVGAVWGVYDNGYGGKTWSAVSDSYYEDTDFADGGEGDDEIIGSRGSDQLLGGAGNDVLRGLAGNDDLQGGDDDDLLEGDGNIANKEMLNYQAPEFHGADFLDGGAGNDRILGQGSDDVLYGGSGDDNLWGDSPGMSSDANYVPFEYQGNDYLDGEDGDDVLSGGGKDDTLHGGAGKDTLWGDASAVLVAAGPDPLFWGRDVLDGEAGDDVLVGGGKDDQLYGGTGDDKLWGDENSPSFSAEASGIDFLDGGDGDDQLVGGGRGDRLLGGAGKDVLIGDDDVYVPAAFQGDDYLDGGAGDDMLAGGLGNDTLFGGEGNDTLNGGGGDDYMVGGAGNDTYVIDSEGDIIVETGADQRGAGGSAGGSTPPAPGGAGTEPGFNNVEASMSYTLGAHLTSVKLTGTHAINATGNSASNSLFGNGADNVLTGAAGDDYVLGGAGNDVYAFDRGDGQDTIENIDVLSDSADPARAPSIDILRFGANISDRDIVAYRVDDILSLRIRGSSEQINVLDYFAANKVDGTVTFDRKFDRVEFANGVIWDQSMIQSVVDRRATNRAPVGNYATVPLVSSRAGEQFSYALPVDLMSDPDAWDSVTYSATLSDGSALPAWLTFDASEMILSGTPTNGSAGTLKLMIAGTDSFGASIGATLDMVIAPPNLAPKKYDRLYAAEATRGTVFSYRFGPGAFTDANNDVLAFSARLSTGAPLPAWLSFDPATRTFSGTPTELGRVSVEIIATDPYNLSASGTFDIVVPNRAPTRASMHDLGVAMGQTLNYVLPEDAFIDGDSADKLSYQVSLADGGALPAWLSFDATTNTFSGKATATGGVSIRVTATDMNAGSMSSAFDLRIDNSGLVNGTESVDSLRAGAGHDTLNGAGGSDALFGGFGNDNLDGGAGDDALEGGAGADTYYFGKGSGHDAIFDEGYADAADIDTVQLGVGIIPADIKATRQGELLRLTVVSTGEQLDVKGQFPGTPSFRNNQIERLRFADGSIWDQAAIAANARIATAGADELHGTDGADTIAGGTGADQLYGELGDDVLEGGSGDDRLYGGMGNDTYLFARGDGRDVISEEKNGVQSSADVLRFGTSIAPSDVKVARSGRDLVLTLKDSGESVLQTNYFMDSPDQAARVEQIVFGDGTMWDAVKVAELASLSTAGDDELWGDTAGNSLDGGSGSDTIQGMAGNDVLNGGADNDVIYAGDGDDVIDGGAGQDRYRGGLGNDVYLFGKGSGHDTLENDDASGSRKDVVRLGPGITADDVSVTRWRSDLILTIRSSNDTLYVTDYFSLGAAKIDALQFADGTAWTSAMLDQKVVQHVNNGATTVARPLPALEAMVGKPFEFVVPADTVVDPDAADYISYTLMRQDFTPAPAWLTFNPNTNRVSGTPGLAEAGLLELYVLARDQIGSGVYASLTIDIVSGNRAPKLMVPLQDHAAAQGAAMVLPVAAAFADADKEDVLVYTAKLSDGSALPDWLGFDGTTGIFTGTPTVLEVIDVIVTATDRSGLRASDAFELRVDIQGVYVRGSAQADLLHGGTGSDRIFGYAGNDSLSGGEGDDEIDGGLGDDRMNGGAGDDTFLVDSAGDTVVELAEQGSDTVKATASWTLGDNLENLTLDGTGPLAGAGNSLANALTGSAGDNVLTGAAGNDTLIGGDGNDVYVINRGDGQDTIDNLDRVGTVDAIRFGSGILPNDIIAVDTGYAVILKIKGTSDQVTIKGHHDDNTDEGGTESNRAINQIQFANGETWDYAMLEEVINRAETNQAPKLTAPLPALHAGAGTAFTYTVPVGTITDPDPWDSIKYSAKLQNGNALPAWLRFDPATRMFSGTPALSDVGAPFQFVLWGTDNYGRATGQTVTMSVTAPNRAPAVSAPIADQAAAQGVAFNYAFAATTFADPDSGDTLTYSATLADGSILPAWLKFTPAMRAFSATSTVAGNFGIKVTATDKSGLSTSDIFDLVVTTRNLVLNGTAGIDVLNGAAGNDAMSGLAGNDTLKGYEGNDTLNGGLGSDLMSGGVGDDLYVVDVAGDSVLEGLGEGNDQVQSSVSLVLAANVESLVLTGTAALNGTGNGLNNTLNGNAGANVIDGAGGADVMAGGAGDDTYSVDNVGDVVTETAGAGTDTIVAALTWTLPAGVEKLTLSGTASINATGNSVANVLTGNSGANVLDGGAGADTMSGGLGDDTYVVDIATDSIIENAAAGTDLVKAAIAYTLGNNLENLTLSGSTAINGTGNTLNNVLTGNSGVNTLTGALGNDTLDGGAGADMLAGGAGADTYRFGRGYGADTIQENDATANTADVLQFLAGVSADQIWLRKVANNLELSVIGTGDKVTMSNWYLGNQYHVERLSTSDGKTLLDSQVQNLVNAMAAFAPPAAGQTTLPANYATSLAPTIAANWR
ncbi:putative Ig domain-containing protein [Massilia scottii]|uniref:putative Ig domain-containing protein n=1 Tax=Massilia scottii TaxID=3057166 RepID=UPI002796A257|nr:putative Ig domain-containing protein [Massilia sp. CCM 9029]MDQ1833427.1 putative Ig domain-containing protein [Massilia sp. CCM 9029]